MKLKEFTDNLLRIMKENPKTADFDVVASKDDEGNGFSLVHFDPSIGHYIDNEFREEQESNAICIN